MEQMLISDIKSNPDNPRTISDEKLEQLVKSIKDFPEMLKLRPVVIDSDNTVLGGNMRLKACQKAGIESVPVLRANDLTEEQRKEFIIKDNVGFGEWDWATLGNDWDKEMLSDWGLVVPDWEEESERAETDVPDYSDKNKEIDVDDFEDEMTLLFKFSPDEFSHITNFLATKDANKEVALLNLSGYERV